MKKINLIIAMAMSPALLAQEMANLPSDEKAFDQGKVVISAGIGFPNFAKQLLKIPAESTNIEVKGFGPINLGIEYGVSKNFGVQFKVNHQSAGAEWNTDSMGFISNSYSAKRSVTAYNLRFNGHFAGTEKLDMYAGFGAGYNHKKIKLETDDQSYTLPSAFTNLFPLSIEFGLGMRYYFTPNIGMYVEMGWAKSVIQSGIVAKF